MTDFFGAADICSKPGKADVTCHVKRGKQDENNRLQSYSRLIIYIYIFILFYFIFFSFFVFSVFFCIFFFFFGLPSQNWVTGKAA